MSGAWVDEQRAAQLSANLAAVRSRIERACAAAGRDPGEVTLVVVTKYFPAADVRALAQLGVSDFGENRDQEAGPKYAEVRAGLPGLTLHFIGQLQTNKAASVAAYADVVHTIDRPKLVHALDRGAERGGRRLRVLVQVALDRAAPAPAADRPELHRGGAAGEQTLELADLVAQSGWLELGGVMAVAPLDEDPDMAFARLAQVAAAVRERYAGACWISAGMSGDLEAAVRHGATHLRVGTAILGSRPTLR